MPKQDLNTVSSQDLERVPMIGKEHARKITDYRVQNGEFKSWEDIKKVPGITTEMLDTLKRSGFTINGKAA
jgi:competence protein ComEA